SGQVADLGESPGGVSYVPYVERSLSDGEPSARQATEAAGGSSPIRAAQYDGLLSSQREAAQSARAIHQRSEGLLQRRFSSQRQDQAAGDETP
ncbi:MAG: hypothetical protein J5I93_03730, partial [Pirellulaceae bacterium]|nr:hypothetical protein [Pirellulaceae bacterium]